MAVIRSESLTTPISPPLAIPCSNPMLQISGVITFITNTGVLC